MADGASTDTPHAVIESVLLDQWHADLCGCAKWPDDCYTFGEDVLINAPDSWTLEAVLAALSSAGWQIVRGDDDSAAYLRGLLTDVVVAAGRMADGWAEGDDAVKRRLWTDLHAAAGAAEDEVYPL